MRQARAIRLLRDATEEGIDSRISSQAVEPMTEIIIEGAIETSVKAEQTLLEAQMVILSLTKTKHKLIFPLTTAEDHRESQTEVDSRRTTSSSSHRSIEKDLTTLFRRSSQPTSLQATSRPLINSLGLSQSVLAKRGTSVNRRMLD